MTITTKRRQVMIQAHQVRRALGVSMSAALRYAWNLIKKGASEIVRITFTKVSGEKVQRLAYAGSLEKKGKIVIFSHPSEGFKSARSSNIISIKAV